MALRFVETEREKGQQQYRSHLFNSLKLTFETSSILWTVLLAMLLGFAYRTAF